jgi:hypothetical protein
MIYKKGPDLLTIFSRGPATQGTYWNDALTVTVEPLFTTLADWPVRENTAIPNTEKVMMMYSKSKRAFITEKGKNNKIFCFFSHVVDWKPGSIMGEQSIKPLKYGLLNPLNEPIN